MFIESDIMEIIIEKLKIKDIDEVLKLYEKLVPVKQDYELSKKKYKDLYYSDKYTVLVAKSDDKILGTITSIVCDSIGFGGYSFMILDYLYVKEEYRNIGIATKLFENIENIAVSNNCGYIFFVSSSNNTEAHKLYEKLGYNDNVVGFRKVLINNGE